LAGEHPLPPGTSIAQAYDDAGQGLLILGEPGAGKTTLLLDLARELLTRAQGDPLQPIPVIVNLSSWATKQPPLATWLTDQLQLVYQVPSRLVQAWLEHDQWLLLLDGLDEVEVSARSACIQAINTSYRGEHFVPLVVCSRSREYTAQEVRLALPGAVVVQPLQKQEIVDYLKRVGKPMMAVRAALRTNPILQQLITTPLMLNVIILAYRDKTAKDLPQLGTLEEQQQQIFERYVERMLEQRAVMGKFSPQQTRKWLIWLAQHMKQHQLTDFYLERLQPEWLPTQRSRIVYRLLVGLLVGLVWLFQRSDEIQHTEVLNWSWKNLWWGLLVGLVVGLLFGLVVGLFSGGEVYLQHYILRAIFWRDGAMPWHYVRFLDEAAERILLQKVGGGYRFIHPLFLNYFASQGTTTADVPEQSSSQNP